MITNMVNISKNELKNILKNFHFALFLSGFIILLTLIILINLPDSNISLERPMIGIIYIYMVIAFIIIINSFLSGKKANNYLYTIKEWSQKGNFTPGEIILGRIFTIIYYNIFILLTTLPIGLLVRSGGGFSFRILFVLYMVAFITGITISLLGFYITEVFDNYYRIILNINLFLYCLGIIIVYSNLYENAYLSLNYHLIYLIISIILIFDLRFSIMSFLFANK